MKTAIYKLSDLLKLKVTAKTTAEQQDMMLDKKAKKLFSESYRTQHKLTVVHILVFRECIRVLKSAVESKRENMTIGEGVLVELLSVAIKKAPDFSTNLDSLFLQLSETLFKSDFTKAMIQIIGDKNINGFKLPENNDELWKIHFPECFPSASGSVQKKKKVVSRGRMADRKVRNDIAKKAAISTIELAENKTKRPRAKSTTLSHKKTTKQQTNSTRKQKEHINMKKKSSIQKATKAPRLKSKREVGNDQGKKKINNEDFSSPIATLKKRTKPPEKQVQDRKKRLCPSSEKKSTKRSRFNYSSPTPVGIRKSPRTSVASNEMRGLMNGVSPPVKAVRKSPRISQFSK